MRMWMVAVTAAALMTFGLPAASQTPSTDAFSAPLALNASPARTAMVARLRTEHAVGSISVVRLNTRLFRSATASTPVTFNLSPTVRLLGVTRATSMLAGGRLLWRGDIAGSGDLPKGDATIVVDGDSATGTIVAPDGSHYQLRPIGNGEHAVIKIDYAKLPKEEPEGNPRIRAPEPATAPAPPPAAADKPRADKPTADGNPAADEAPTVDLLVAYTPSAATASGGIDALIDLAIAETNQSFVNSGVNAKVRLAGKLALNYVETGSSQTFNSILADFVGNSTVNTQRDSVGADVSVLLINRSDYCGLADDINGTAATAFVIVDYSCATGYYSFGHEIGHIVGARHDLADDSTLTPYAYGHGYQVHKTTGGWRTIMSYACTAGDCPTRIQYWSNPSVNYSGQATGTSDREDNHRVWNERASTVEGFRASQFGPSYAGQLYQLHNTGAIWQSTGVSCGSWCSGWEQLDNNPAATAITAGGSSLYELHNTGRIWRYTGTPCSSSGCLGWQMIDDNPAAKAIVAAGASLYQLHNTGKIWVYTGTPCAGASCPGWQMIDDNPATVAIVASGSSLYQLHNTGKIWRYTGTPCSGSSCPGWQLLDNNSKTKAIAAGGGQLYQIHTDGAIWSYTGTPCTATGCPGWRQLDSNPAGVAILADGSNLYQLHNTGKIWRYTGTPCSSTACPGWTMLDDNPATKALAGDGSHLFQLHDTGKIWISTGAACSGTSCPGWTEIDNNPKAKAITGPNP